MTEPRDPPVHETEAPSPGSQPQTRQTELRTFLIADIRGYTTFTSERGDEAGAALAAQFADLVAEVVTARDGVLIELRGDEALVMFVSARKALRAAIDMQARFAEAQLPRGVGIGLDAGEAIPVGDGYRGTALNLAARLCAEAGPGETLASETVIHLAARMEGIAYVDARALRLKGYADSVRVVDVVPSDRAKGRRLASGNGWAGRNRARYAVVGLAGLLVVALVATMLGAGLLGRGGPSASPAGTTAALASGAPSNGPNNGPSGLASNRPSTEPTDSPDPLASAGLPLLAFYDATTGALNATTPLTTPRNISFFSDGSFWILTDYPKTFHRLDPVSHRIVQSINVPLVETSGFNFDDDSLWVTDLAAPQIVRIDKRTGIPTYFPFGADAEDLAVAVDVAIGDGSVWLTRPDVPEIVRLDADTGEVQARIPVQAFGASYGGDGMWYANGGRIGRIDPVTNEPAFDPVQLTSDGFIGNMYIGGGDAWTTEVSSGRVWRVGRSGQQRSFTLDPGVGEMGATDKTMWVTNANTGALTGIDLLTGRQDRVIDTGHAVLAVAAGGNELMIAVGPTVGEAIADLDGTVLTVAAAGTPWNEPGAGPDPALNGTWEVTQALYLTCVALLNYPDEPAPLGWELKPEVAAAMPTVSADGRTYTFTIKPGYRFSPPSNEPLTAETFRATIERTLSPVFDDFAPGPQIFGDIEGVTEYREGTSDHVSGLVAEGDKLTITLEAPSPTILDRLALSFACPVPARTPVLRSGLDPDPPISGAGPYYVAQVIRKRLVVLKKNPNYPGPRAQPFDAIAIVVDTSAAVAIDKVQRGELDAAMLPGFDPISGPGGALATEWGPGSGHAEAGDQRWFGAPRTGMDYIALNSSRPAFRDPDVRRAVSLALDRAAIATIFVTAPAGELFGPAFPESSNADAPPRDFEAARALMNGRTFDVNLMGYPEEWDCGVCRDFEVALIGQLSAIGITVHVVQPEEFREEAFEPESTIDLIHWGTGSDVPDAVALMNGLHDIVWLPEASLQELDRLQGLTDQARIDGALAFADSLVDEQALILPTNYPVYPFLVSERIGCGFVQPAIGAVDLLSLCIEDGAAGPGSPASPGTPPP